MPRSVADDCGALQRFLDHRANRFSRRKFRVLQNAGEPDTLANRDFAAVHIFVAGQNSKQRGFPRTVWTDQSDPVALGNGEGDILKKHGRSERLRDALCIDDRRQRLVPCFLLSCEGFGGPGRVRTDDLFRTVPLCKVYSAQRPVRPSGMRGCSDGLRHFTHISDS